MDQEIVVVQVVMELQEQLQHLVLYPLLVELKEEDLMLLEPQEVQVVVVEVVLLLEELQHFLEGQETHRLLVLLKVIVEEKVGMVNLSTLKEVVAVVLVVMDLMQVLLLEEMVVLVLSWFNQVSVDVMVQQVQ